jgi:hypothetical protein
VFIGSAVSGAATEPNRPPNIQGHRGGSKVLAGASAEEVLKIEIVHDVDPDLGAFEEAPNSPSRLYHLASTSEVGLAPPPLFFFFLALPHPEHQDAQWPVGIFRRPLHPLPPVPLPSCAMNASTSSLAPASSDSGIHVFFYSTR